MRLGLFDDLVLIQGVCELSVGYPNPDSSYLGLLILSPDIRGSGYGAILFDRMKNAAIEKLYRIFRHGSRAQHPRARILGTYGVQIRTQF